MKSPLEYQATECDCCPATFKNAFKYLFERSEIPAEVIKETSVYTLDRMSARGTTREATKALVSWLNEYTRTNNFNLECIRLEGNIVNTKLIKEEFKENTVIILRLWSLYEHYVLLTKVDEKYFYLFDPYYDLDTTFINDKDVEVITGNEHYNRKVKIERFDLIDNKKDYTLGVLEKRECVIMRRINND